MSITNGLASTPPMGWNSWDCYGTTVREAEVKANADYIAAHLARHGWEYVVVDIQWYEPNAKAHGYRPNADLVIDAYGRLLPAENRFPSAADGAGFKRLADYVHSLGLKFGIHIMRGIPHQAVRQNLPILNTKYHAQDIADPASTSSWNDDMLGVDTSKPGAQAYYDSIVALYASWEVDFIKADDMIWPYHDQEIDALSQAISRVNRPIALSLSPGVSISTDRYEHLKSRCELFRISADFWDRWEDLKNQFANCAKWVSLIEPGCWADADMLPLGRIGIRAERGIDRQSLLTRDEQITLMTLWAISRSPLMFGGDLPSNDDFTLSLLTNDDLIRLLRSSRDNRELLHQGDFVAWSARSTDSNEGYLALFNLGDQPLTLAASDFNLALLGQGGRFQIHDLWQHANLDALHPSLAPHASHLYRLTSV